MTIDELNQRMLGFLSSDYWAYFFLENKKIVGYALVNHCANPLYLRQFFICRNSRKQHFGAAAFKLLLSELGVDTIDLEVLSHNEVGRKFWESGGFKERSRYLRLSKKT